MKIAGKLMDWVRRKREPHQTAELLAKIDKTLLEGPALVELYRRQLEVLTGRGVTWPYVERRKVPRDK